MYDGPVPVFYVGTLSDEHYLEIFISILKELFDDLNLADRQR